MMIFYGILTSYLMYLLRGFRVPEGEVVKEIKERMLIPREDFDEYVLLKLSEKADRVKEQADNKEITLEEWNKTSSELYREAGAIEAGDRVSEMDYLHRLQTRKIKWIIFRARMSIRFDQVTTRALAGYPLLIVVIDAVGWGAPLVSANVMFVLVCTALAISIHAATLKDMSKMFKGMSKESIVAMGYESIDDIEVSRTDVITSVLTTQIPFFLMLIYLGWGI